MLVSARFGTATMQMLHTGGIDNFHMNRGLHPRLKAWKFAQILYGLSQLQCLPSKYKIRDLLFQA